MNTEEELQNNLLSDISDDSLDGAAYKKVFKALSQEPDFNLPINFADQIILQIERKEAKSVTHEMYWLIAGIFILLIAALISALLVGFKPSFGVFKFLAGYPGLFVFGLAFVLLIQWLDKKLVRPRFS